MQPFGSIWQICPFVLHPSQKQVKGYVSHNKKATNLKVCDLFDHFHDANQNNTGSLCKAALDQIHDISAVLQRRGLLAVPGIFAV